MVCENNSRARVLVGKPQQMQLVCRNERAEPAKVLGECRVHMTVVRADSCSDNPAGSLGFLCPSHSRTFLAGGARPAREALAAPVPLQPVVTNAIVTGTFCRETQTPCHTSQAHQHSAAAISLPALLLMQHVKLPSRKCHRSIKRKHHRSSSSGSLSA